MEKMGAPLELTRKFGLHYQIALSWRWEASKLLLEVLAQNLAHHVAHQGSRRMEKVPVLSLTSMTFSHLQLRQLKNPARVRRLLRGQVGSA
jgi:hypothetical protein